MDKCAWPGCKTDWIEDKLSEHPIMAKFCKGHKRFCRDHDETFQMLSPGCREVAWKAVMDNDEAEFKRAIRNEIITTIFGAGAGEDDDGL